MVLYAGCRIEVSQGGTFLMTELLEHDKRRGQYLNMKVLQVWGKINLHLPTCAVHTYYIYIYIFIISVWMNVCNVCVCVCVCYICTIVSLALGTTPKRNMRHSAQVTGSAFARSVCNFGAKFSWVWNRYLKTATWNQHIKVQRSNQMISMMKGHILNHTSNSTVIQF